MTNHTTALGRPGIALDQWTVLRQQADVLVKSGFLPSNIRSAEQAIAVMLKGQELGIPPMYALSNVVVLNGKTTCSAELMAALIYRDHGDSALQFERSDATACTISYARRTATGRKTFTYSIEDAQRAGVTGGQTWQKYPAAMLRARCISAVARFAFPDAIAGMYTSEELDNPVAVDPATGEIMTDVIESTAREVPPVETLPVAPAAPTPYPPLPDPDSERLLAQIKRAVTDLGWGEQDRLNYLKPWGVTRFGALTVAALAEIAPDLDAKAAQVQEA